MVTTCQLNTRWALRRQSSNPPCIHIALALFSPEAWSTQFETCSKVCSRAGMSEDRKNLQNHFLVLEKNQRWPHSTETNKLCCPLLGLVPARWGGPPQTPSRPLGCPLSRSELGGGISAALRYGARKVLSEMAAASQEQAGMGYNGKEKRFKINTTITSYKQPALLF